MSTPCPKPTKEKKPKRRRPKSERRLLEKRLDDLMSAVVIMRDKRCVTCGTTSGLTKSHFVKCGKKNIRWDLVNVNCQCSTCNGKHNRWPEAYTAWMIRKYGAVEVLRLTDAGQVNAYQWSIIDLRDLDLYLTAKYQALLETVPPEVREWAIRRVG